MGLAGECEPRARARRGTVSDASPDLPALIRPEPGPATCKAAPWAGERLRLLRGSGADGPRIAESWEFSTLAGSESRALGRALSETIGRPLPFLAKLIDTAAPLSIQVHPEDDPAAGRLGKEEAWVILDAAEDATLLVGVREGIADATLHATMLRAIEDAAEGERLVESLDRLPVERGMVVLVPAGTVHSIGPGILLAEIQQPTDCTHRLFDYGSDRPIHPEEARAAWRVDARPSVWRPGDPVRPIRGRHLALDVWGPGTSRIESDGVPRLLMAVGEGVEVGVDDEAAEPLAHGELRLHLRGTLRIEVATGGQLVTGFTHSASHTADAD